MEKKLKIGLTVVVVTVVMMAVRLIDPVHELKNNPNEKLQCYMESGYEIIPKENITGYIEEKDTWTFTNGYSRNCEIINTKETK